MRRLIPLLLLIATVHAFAGECPAWTPEHASQEMRALDQQLRAWDAAYHRDGYSPIDDTLYDQSHARYAQWRTCFPDRAPPVAELLRHRWCRPGLRRSPTRMHSRHGCMRVAIPICGFSPRPMVSRSRCCMSMAACGVRSAAATASAARTGPRKRL